MPTQKTWTDRGGYKSYGKSALKQSLGKNGCLTLSGMTEWIDRIAQAGLSLKELTSNTLQEVGEEAAAEMRTLHLSYRKQRTGAVYRAIRVFDIEEKGERLSLKVGLDLKAEPKAIHGVFQEYGGRNRGADPFIRPAVDNAQIKLRPRLQQNLKDALGGG